MRVFYYVYILESAGMEPRFYTGLTGDLKARLRKHNNGAVPYTAKFRPWRLKTAMAFASRERAAAFERYLKSSSGRAFAKKRLRTMCYRYTLTDLKALLALVEATGLGVDVNLDDFPARYNIALTQHLPVVTRRGKPRIETLRFGLSLPGRSPTEKSMLLANARAGTLLAKTAFRDAARHRRCLVPADGFYEWEKQGRTRLPHYFTLKSGGAFFFAGLWEPETDTAPGSFAIVTTTPNAVLRPIHDRMPVILGPNSGPAWLVDEPLTPARLARLCRPLSADLMTGHRVDSRVNNVRYEAADCIAAV